MSFDRRSFLQTSLLLSAAGFRLFPKAQAQSAFQRVGNDLLSRGPIEELNEFRGTTEFTGDHEMAAHEIFWDKDGFLKKHGPLPPPEENYEVVVIGGGIAGLASAHFHRNQKTLLLEGHPQMGGNSRAERYQKLQMSLGAAYINVPEEGDPLDLFLKELGLRDQFRREETEDFTLGVNGKLVSKFWDQSEEFRRVHDKFVEIFENDYPELPLYEEGMERSRFNALDRQTFTEWIGKNLGEIHPHILEFFHQYCWSSFGGAPDEISAAQAVGFIASDLNGVMALPGGNAVIADGIYRRLKASKVRLMNNAFAVNVRSIGGAAEVSYFEDGKRLRTVRAKKVIIAAPKLVARFLVEGLSNQQAEAMRELRYRAYLLVNVLLDTKISSPGYDLYALRNRIPRSEKKEMDERGFCDIIYADWANFDSAQQSALTLYVPQPYQGANQFLFSPYAYEKHQSRILNNLGPWLENADLSTKNVLGMRMSRYGHALPLARAGLIASGKAELAHAPIDDTIYFAHSDNWANPCLETAFYSARAAFALSNSAG